MQEPQFEPFVDDSNLQTIAKKPASRLRVSDMWAPRSTRPIKWYCWATRSTRSSPTSGSARTAPSGTSSLDKCLDSHDNGADALRAFSRERAPEAGLGPDLARLRPAGLPRLRVLHLTWHILDSIFHAVPQCLTGRTRSRLYKGGTPSCACAGTRGRDRLHTNSSARGRAVPRGVLCAFVGAPRAGDAGGAAARRPGRRGGPRGGWLSPRGRSGITPRGQVWLPADDGDEDEFRRRWRRRTGLGGGAPPFHYCRAPPCATRRF